MAVLSCCARETYLVLLKFEDRRENFLPALGRWARLRIFTKLSIIAAVNVLQVEDVHRVDCIRYAAIVLIQ